MEMTIVGGGIAGLSAAIALARIGIRCRLLERAAVFCEEGAGLQLGPNGVRALERLGLWPTLETHCFSPPCLRIMDAISGEPIRSFAFASFRTRFGAPYRVIHRRDLLKSLLDAARAVESIELLTSHEVTGLTWNDDEPVLLLGTKKLPASAVIGADGLNSVIRRNLLGDGAPHRHPHVIYRALIPRVTVPHLPSDVVLWLCPGGHVVHYPVSGGREMNIVAITDKAPEIAAEQSCSAAEVSACFEPMSPDLRYVLGLASSWRRWVASDRPPAAIWGRGKTTLMGDAAHPMLPTLAQGAVAALEDAVLLADSLATGGDVAAAFRRYEYRRRTRVSRLQKASRAQSTLYHLDGWPRALRNIALRHMPESWFFSRINWIYV
jgi:2-polyprenyl-6-methoxyphenol hydroxylase-like FAD-dependent oxidoreductase